MPVYYLSSLHFCFRLAQGRKEAHSVMLPLLPQPPLSFRDVQQTSGGSRDVQQTPLSFRDVQPVSYTHLTLPTNREV